jgi:hypothetical protein
MLRWRLRVPAALGLLVLLAGAALGQAEWHKMTGPDKSFTAELPESPRYTPVQLRSPVGKPYTMHQYLHEQGAVAFVVQTVVYPSDVNVSSPQVNLQNGLDNAARNMDGGKWASVEWIKHQGLTAADATGARGGSEVRSLLVIKGRQLVTLTYAGPPGSARSDDANRFIASLRLAP